jgi:hypothetical protein
LRYYFHFFSGGERFEDRKGEELASSVDAVAHAQQLVRQLGLDFTSTEQTILITDAKGNEIAQVPLKPGADDPKGT